MIRRIRIFLIMVVLGLTAHAQLMDDKAEFTKKDSLRGMSTILRKCYDVTAYDLSINLDIPNRFISGSNKIYLKAVYNFNQLQIDLFENMVIDKIVYQGKELHYTREYDAVFVDFDEAIGAGSTIYFEVFYHGNPIVAKHAPWDGGFVFTKDANGKDWVGVACEGVGASLWWPTKEDLSDEAEKVTFSCTHPSGLVCVSNGNLTNESNNGNGTTTTTWQVNYPINNYNVTLNLGDFVHFGEVLPAKDGAPALNCDYYVLSYNLKQAQKQFKQVKTVVAAYQHYFGPYPYPNDGYALVETPYLGMEHQGAIAYGNHYRKGYDGNDYSRIGLKDDYIIVHETGHEWFGNNISCSDLADMWIHESFTTYAEALFVEYKYGKKKAQEYVNAKKPTIGNKSPIYGVPGVNAEGDGDMYNKGMLFLNTLRTNVDNDSIWFAMLRDMNTHQFKNATVDYNGLVDYVNRFCKRNYTPIFNQYIKEVNIPTLVYKVERKNKYTQTLYYKWKTDQSTFLMRFKYSINGKKMRMGIATQDWKSRDFKSKKPAKIKIDQNSEYINVEQFTE